MKKNWQYALLAFSLALISWYFVSGREKVDIWLDTTVQLTGMPEQLVITEGLKNRLSVRVRGPRGLMRSLENKTLTYALNLSKLRTGLNVYPLEADKMPLSKSFEIMEINPPRLELIADHVMEKTLPIKPVWVGTLDMDYKLFVAIAKPDSVIVRGPKKIVSDMGHVATQDIVLPSSTPNRVNEVVALLLPPSVETENKFAEVTLSFGVKTEERSFEVPVIVENDTEYNVVVRPDKVRVKATLPVTALRDKKLEKRIAVFARVEPYWGAGAHVVECEVRLPKGGTILHVEPRWLEVTLTE